ncbi:MAG: HD domain-containing protein [Bacteroidales bacterium]|jgi:GTP pyrophosphokinase|nr:HD domain-containing protein [Bacteroidales bacterium]
MGSTVIWDELIDCCRGQLLPTEVDSLRRACEAVSLKVDATQACKTADVALIVAKDMGMGYEPVIAALVCQTLPKDDIATFGATVEDIVCGLWAVMDIDTGALSQNPENYRKFLLAMAGDLRGILVKIAMQLAKMRTLESIAPEERHKTATETSLLYAPLAHRLGLYSINSELLDLCLKFLNPDAFTMVSERLKESEAERRDFVEVFVRPIKEKLRQRGFNFEMKARTKSINSIWNKMKKQNVTFDEVYDLFAIRVILDSRPEMEKSDCWQVYSVVTEEYQANPERMRDWITVPKSNGYESLHATVLGPQKKWVEIQIRTARMNEIAEKGIAAHWKYKGGQSSPETEKWLAAVREVLENPAASMTDFMADFRTNIYSDEIFVFTPKGELVRLPNGATLLDFAYEVHSQVGDRCTGGLVDGRKVTLKYRLNNGEQINVSTSNSQHPKLDWLDFVVTTKAKSRIKASLNEAQKREAERGKEILFRKLKNWKFENTDEIIRKLLRHYNLKLAQELYFRIATGKIDTLHIKGLIEEKNEEPTVSQKLEELLPKEQLNDMDVVGAQDYLLIDNDIRNVNHKLAPCCNPVFGDEIFGFITIREGIKIHRKSCPNARQMNERYPYRIIPARWRHVADSHKMAFQAAISISGTDDAEIVSRISAVIAKDGGAHLRAININAGKGLFDGILNVTVNNVGHLDFLIQKLKRIRGVLHVVRTE